MKKIKGLIKKIYNLSLFYSIYFNFRVLPLKQAIHLPFLCEVWPTILKNTGKVKIENAKIRRFMIRIGAQRTPIYPSRSFVWRNEGTIVFKGKCRLGHHMMIKVTKNGYLELGDQTALNTGSRIVCQKEIILRTKPEQVGNASFMIQTFIQ